MKQPVTFIMAKWSVEMPLNDSGAGLDDYNNFDEFS